VNLRPLSVDDVHRRLLARIRGGSYPVGGKLPSVRTLAGELGSNPSTVDRALHRLAQSGVVRTVPRQGTYVATMDVPGSADVGGDAGLLERAIVNLRSAGMSVAEVRRLVDSTLDSVFADPKVLFIECNTVDLEQMARTVTNATGVDLIPMLLDDVPEEVDHLYDVIVTPLFHITELNGLVGDFARVVELNFQPAPAALRRIALLDSSARVVVTAPTERGKERMLSLTQQFFLGQVDTHNSRTDDPGAIAGYDAVVYTNAAQLDPGILAAMPHPILIEWELDPVSSASFLARIEAAVAR
jgi:DNA-binding transcriptional regulator YhcF (GntR family)